MSFNRLNYDTGTYRKELNQSVGPGAYVLNQPHISCEPCYPYSSSIRLQKSGGSINSKISMVDLDSELLGLYRKNSNNPDKKYKPKCPDSLCNSGEPCGPGVSSSCSHNINIKSSERQGDEALLKWNDCFEPPEDTRLSNPPCTMRETEINRFEWLCEDPQNNVEIPFATNISNRIIVKDNHRPILPTPISCIPVLPKQKGLCSEKIMDVYANNTSPLSTHWKTC